MVSWWNCSVGKPSSVEDTRVIVLSVSPSATWKETGSISTALSVSAASCLIGRQTATLNAFPQHTWVTLLRSGKISWRGSATRSVVITPNSPKKLVPQENTFPVTVEKTTQCDDPQAMSVICFSESDGIRRGVCE